MHFDHESKIKSKSKSKISALDVLVAVGAIPLDEIAPGKALLFPVVKMLSKMTEGGGRDPAVYTEAAREETTEYGRQDPLADREQEQD